MKTVHIIHNPSAGKGDHSKKEIRDLVDNEKMEVAYISTDSEQWNSFDPNKSDMVLVAGGDGTIQKTASVILETTNSGRSLPIGVIPLGTANNIAKSIGIQEVDKLSVQTLNGKIKNFDYGLLDGVKESDFFLESVGCGLLAELISQMREDSEEKDAAPPDDKMQMALERLRKIAKKYKSVEARISFDGIRIKGKFLMVEVMNIPMIGPNCKFAPDAKASDGWMNLILVPEDKRKNLLAYLDKRIKGEDEEIGVENFVTDIRIKKASLQWDSPALHIDDQLAKNYKGKKFTVKVARDRLEFLLPS